MYRLQKYYWRSSLTLVGPLFVVAYYVFMCLTFLRSPPHNDVIQPPAVSARWMYYAWIIATIFMLDLSRTGLANIEAAALMHPRLAPADATKLMWHADSKWANPLWWLRACRAGIQVWFRPQTPTPGLLWTLLSLTTVMIFIGLPLSGLSVELSDVKAPTTNVTSIYGPSALTFNNRSKLGLPQRIRSRWQSGLPTTPTYNGVLYAPYGTSNVTLNYFNDRALDYATSIEFFTGPTVHNPVSGRAWGVHANISCNPVPTDHLQALRITNLTWLAFEVNACPFDKYNTSCELEWTSNMTRLYEESIYNNTMFPLIVDEKGVSQIVRPYSFVAIADGFSLWGWPTIPSPYEQASNHDGMTFDSMVGNRPEQEVTTAIFEMYLWQSDLFHSDMLADIAKGGFSDPVDIYNITYSAGSHNMWATGAGMGIHCDVTTQVGSADLHAGERTFSSFRRNNSLIRPGTGGDVTHVYPAQVLALAALASHNESADHLGDEGQIWNALYPSRNTQPWLDLHYAVNSPGSELGYGSRTGSETLSKFPSLRPKDLQLALYRLLGHSVIAMMDEGGVDPWLGELYDLGPAKHIVDGVVLWPSVLVFLSIWALVMSGGALWTIFFASPRWATSLGGFEMFKFGAQYTDEVDDFTAVDFRACSNALGRIPGMVGMLPGTGGSSNPPRKLGFVGLSENVTGRDVEYTFRRTEAALTRPW